MAKSSKARLPPRWFVRTFWRNHRRVYRLTGGRLGLWRAKPNRWGAMCVRAVGRRSGLERRVIVGYFEDGENLVVMAMNGWGEAEPLWWLNVQAHPDVQVDLVDGPRQVTAHAADGAERAPLGPLAGARPASRRVRSASTRGDCSGGVHPTGVTARWRGVALPLRNGQSGVC